jgi:hypothetical protein
MILPYGLNQTNNAIKTNNNGTSKPLSNNNIVQANNQNSIFISLKDTLHLVMKLRYFWRFFSLFKIIFFQFLTGISQLNYEYDGYLQRVLQTIIVNFSIKFQMVQLSTFFLL